MQKNMPILAGIDIGSSTVRCVIAFVEGDDNLFSIAGVGTAPCQGVRKGVIVNPDEVALAINSAIEDAERQAGLNIGKATVLINGSHVGSQTSRGVVAISGAGRTINEEDRLRVEEAATVIQMPANREIVQVFAKNYRIDGEEQIKEPIGMQGVRLEVDAQIISASTPAMRSLDLTLERSGIRASSKVVAGLAAAEAVLDRRQKESGTAVVDIGAGTINIAIIEEGEIEHIAVIPVGGQNITNDLAIGLKTTLDVAEKVKLKFAGFNDPNPKECVVEDGNQKQAFDGRMVQMIIEARVEEMLEHVDKEFMKAKRSRKLPGGVVFVGGSANLAGLEDFAKEKLSLPTSIGKVRGITGLLDATKNPEMATPIGIMMLDAFFSTQGTHSDDSGASYFNPGVILSKLKRKLSK
jgi:cell division protein FtsA